MTLEEVILKITLSDVLSSLALMLSVVSIGWNVYRDVLLKPRLKVRVQVSQLVGPGSPTRTFIDISATNHGPGIIICESIFARRRFFLMWLKPKYLFVMRDYTNPLSGQLPKKLEVGESITILLPYTEKMVLARKPTHLGIKDSFGRIHWSDKKSLKLAIEAYLKDFSEEGWKNAPN